MPLRPASSSRESRSAPCHCPTRSAILWNCFPNTLIAASNTATSCGFHLSIGFIDPETGTQHNDILILLLCCEARLLRVLALSLKKPSHLPHYSSSCSGSACPDRTVSPPVSDAPVPAVAGLVINGRFQRDTSAEDTSECPRRPVASFVGARDKWKCLRHTSAKNPTTLAAALLTLVARIHRRHFQSVHHPSIPIAPLSASHPFLRLHEHEFANLHDG